MNDPCPECGFTSSNRPVTGFRFPEHVSSGNEIKRLVYEALDQHREHLHRTLLRAETRNAIRTRYILSTALLQMGSLRLISLRLRNQRADASDTANPHTGSSGGHVNSLSRNAHGAGSTSVTGTGTTKRTARKPYVGNRAFEERRDTSSTGPSSNVAVSTAETNTTISAPLAPNTVVGHARSNVTTPNSRESRKAAKRRRRARLRNVEHSPYKPEAIFERDNRTCQICGNRLHMSKSVPHDWAPTIDHIVPIAQGGPDVPRNIQAAHFQMQP